MTKQEFIRNFRKFLAKAYEAWLLFRVAVRVWLDGFRLSLAIFMCDAMQRAHNKRFYVIRNAQDKLIWVCNDDIKSMRKPRRVKKLINGKLVTFKVSMLPKNTTHMDIMKKCLYYTPTSRNNTDGLTPAERYERRKRWINYMENIRMNRMFGKLKARK